MLALVRYCGPSFFKKTLFKMIRKRGTVPYHALLLKQVPTKAARPLPALGVNMLRLSLVSRDVSAVNLYAQRDSYFLNLLQLSAEDT